jgi:hypothetical protein
VLWLRGVTVVASVTRVSAPMAIANTSAASYRPNDSAAKPTPITGSEMAR